MTRSTPDRTGQVLAHERTYRKLQIYRDRLQEDLTVAGQRLRTHLAVPPATPMALARLLLQTKRPTIFAESQLRGDGSDWNTDELSILGDLAVALPVTTYDDGRHTDARVHAEPFPATLVFVPGALLRNDAGLEPPEWRELVDARGVINVAAFSAFYERRLLAPFRYANAIEDPVVLTIPGIGCGQFAGPFKGQLGDLLKQSLIDLLTKYGEQFTGIRAVYFDPFAECSNERHEFRGTSLMVRPLLAGNTRPQLCLPQDYEEAGDNFSDCHLCSLVAWDPVSWPGNDFYAGARVSDDGVKAAATDTMRGLTGVEGRYDADRQRYEPPAGYRNWQQVVTERALTFGGDADLRLAGENDVLLRHPQE